MGHTRSYTVMHSVKRKVYIGLHYLDNSTFSNNVQYGTTLLHIRFIVMRSDLMMSRILRLVVWA